MESPTRRRPILAATSRQSSNQSTSKSSAQNSPRRKTSVSGTCTHISTTSDDIQDATNSKTLASAYAEFQNLFLAINERRVEEITLDFFYKPHTITLLIVAVSAVFYVAMTRDTEAKSLQENIWHGLISAAIFFLLVGLLTFPNGPFTRPHPLLWRLVFGISVLYLGVLVFLLFQSYETCRSIQLWFFPELRDYRIDAQIDMYAVNCSDITLERVWGHVDVFAAGHYVGWLGKALLIRHYGICWTISVTWEITELAFMHLLPNFAECWWDSVVLDVIVCNGLGIWSGMQLCKILEMRDYKWESLKEIQTTTGKLRRALLQFTPETWTSVRWLDPHSTPQRFLAVTQFVLLWQLTELNTFFLKHVFHVPPGHLLNVGRLVLTCSITAPSIRQYYVYATDTRCKRLGTHCWVYCAILATEAMICIKFGVAIFAQTQLINIIIWILIQFVLSVACIYLCVLWARRRSSEKYGALLETLDGTIWKTYGRHFRRDSSGKLSLHKRTRSCGSELENSCSGGGGGGGDHNNGSPIKVDSHSSGTGARRDSVGTTLIHRATMTSDR